MAITAAKFFETQLAPSYVKSAIVGGYCAAWSTVMTRRVGKRAIGFVDLFAGRGRFEDGTESTPILVVRKALADPLLRQAFRFLFNDKAPAEVSALEPEISGIDGIDGLTHAPRYCSEAVRPEIIDRLGDFCDIPTLLFADPFGYMGISLHLLTLLLRNRMSEGLTFFNTNRINAGMSNEFVREHIDALFGPERAEALRARIATLHGDERERVILDSFEEGLREGGFAYVLRFRFLSRVADRTSHHLFHCARNPLAERIMKDVMDRYSARTFDGVPLFEIPLHESPQLSLFSQPLPPVELSEDLLRSFAGQSLTLHEIIQSHSPGTPYVERNYRAALWHLAEQHGIHCEPSVESMPMRQGRRIWLKITRVTFPAR